MYSRHLKGNIGELKAQLFFLERGYNVSIPISSSSPYDLIVEKDGILERVSVKYTSCFYRGTWNVTLKNVSRRNNGKTAVKEFDINSVELVVIYIQPEDRIVLYKSSDIKTKALLIKPGGLAER